MKTDTIPSPASLAIVSRSTELYHGLALDQSNGALRLSRTDGSSSLPGQARVRLDSLELSTYLRTEHLTPELDKIVHYVHMFSLATPHHGHISALHHQAVRGRRIIPVQDPSLHLVWYHDRIFIKPIPVYMMSHAFWDYLARTRVDLWRTCAGFMRTYAWLIKYEMDFNQAISPALALIPSDLSPTYGDFTTFIAPFGVLPDSQIGDRFSLGELRLGRLNMLARLFLFKRTFFHVESSSGAFLAKVLAPFVTLFFFATTILNGMQVELAVQGLTTAPGSGSEPRFTGFAMFSQWFSLMVIALVFLTFAVILGLLFTILLCDCRFARAMRKRNREDNEGAGRMKSGVV